MENAYEEIVATLQSLQQQVEDLTHRQTQVEMGHPLHVALVDLGVSSCFIHEGLKKKHGIPVLRKNKTVVAEVVDRWPLASGNITMETIPLGVHLGDHDSHICFNVISSPINMVIIGMPWLKKHNPEINWENNKITS
ncbi:hypothetical protein KP509_36G065700 [Ceratopteris richardii]|uniref:Uncharacterized protein n=1 Tax=Ceratopteris richardii TaxID=49495 RepID=A0A8T2QE08_CERRI|nr:hypothetical protein KP509_36G065700 [Ceratopteris richardii]